MFHKNGGSPADIKSLSLQVQRIESGDLPAALEWRKTSIFAVAVPSEPEFIEWVCAAPEGVDQIAAKAWDAPAGVAPSAFVLYGWSNSGADELRRASLDSALVAEDVVNIYVSRPKVNLEGGISGTADMRFVGWEVSLKGLDPGQYSAILHVRRDIISVRGRPPGEERQAADGYQKMSELHFAIRGE